MNCFWKGRDLITLPVMEAYAVGGRDGIPFQNRYALIVVKYTNDDDRG